MPFTRAGARLQGSGPTIHAARRDPRGNPLLRFPPSSGFVPARLAARLSTCGTSPGIPAPTALSEGGVYVASAGRIRPVPTTCRPQGSGPLDGLLLHPPCRAFRPGSTPGVLPTGCFPLEQARRLPPTGFPSWRFSPSLRTRDLGITRTKGATPDDLVGPDAAFYRLQGVSPSESPYRASSPFKRACRPIPSWASSSLGFPCHPRQRDFHPRRSRASPPSAPPSDLAAPERSRLQLHLSVSCPDDSAVLSRGRLPLRGFPPTFPDPCGVHAALAYLPCGPWPQLAGSVTTPCQPLRTVAAPTLRPSQRSVSAERFGLPFEIGRAHV